MTVSTFDQKSLALPQSHENYGFGELAAPPKSDPVAANPNFSSAVSQGCDDMLIAGWGF